MHTPTYSHAHNHTHVHTSHDLMRKCWDHEPEGRPSFSNLVSAICEILEPLAGYLDFKLLPANDSTGFNLSHEDIPSPSNPTIVFDDEAM